MLAQQRRHAGFGAISDHLESVDEVLAFRPQAGEAVFLRQGLDGNVMLCFLAQLFEVADLQIQNLDLFLQVSLALLKPLDLGLGGILG